MCRDKRLRRSDATGRFASDLTPFSSCALGEVKNCSAKNCNAGLSPRITDREPRRFPRRPSCRPLPRRASFRLSEDERESPGTLFPLYSKVAYVPPRAHHCHGQRPSTGPATRPADVTRRSGAPSRVDMSLILGSRAAAYSSVRPFEREEDEDEDEDENEEVPAVASAGAERRRRFSPAGGVE